MPLFRRLSCLLMGSDTKLRRMLVYWLGTGIFYLVSGAVLWGMVANGQAALGPAAVFGVVMAAGQAVFYVLIRFNRGLGIAHWRLALLQAIFAIGCNAFAYALVGPVRGTTLMVTLVIVVFCSFSLRPGQVHALCGLICASMGTAMWWLQHTDPARFPTHVEVENFGMLCISLLAVAFLTGELSRLRLRMLQQRQELVKAMETIQTLATIDELTSLANRRHMHEVLRDEERRQVALGQPICMALLDIDFFKSINDRYGHAGGDAVLRAFADAARAGLRSGDVLARWGGEEFLLLLPNTELGVAAMVLGRMAERISTLCLAELDTALRITFSAGVVARRAGEPFGDAIRRADEAMYLAKARGRDCIVTA